MTFPADQLWQPALILLLLAGVCCVPLIRAHDQLALAVLGWSFVGTVGLYLTHVLGHTTASVRYELDALPGWIAILVLGIGRWRGTGSRVVGLAALGLFLLPNGYSLANNFFNPSFQRDDYRGAFTLIRKESMPDDLLVYDVPAQYIALDYYFADKPLESLGLPVPAREGQDPEHVLSGRNAGDRDKTIRALATAARTRDVWLMEFFPAEPWEEEWLGQNRLLVLDRYFGRIELKHYIAKPTPTTPTAPNSPSIEERFGPLALTQLQLVAKPSSNQLVVKTVWRLDSKVGQSYSVSAQLINRSGVRVAQADGPLVGADIPTSQWLPSWDYKDERLVDLSGLKADVYSLRVAVYNRDGGQQIGNQGTVAQWTVGAASNTAIGARTDAGWSLDTARIMEGNGAEHIVTLEGSIASRPSTNYTWFVHLLNDSGQLVSQDDHPPSFVTSSAASGSQYAETFVLPSGGSGATLEIGAYDASGKRVIFSSAGNPNSDRVLVRLR